jgi:hypothetical protein
MAEEKKEWLVGAPEYKDRSFTLSEVRELIQGGKILGSDLLLRIGDVWKSAHDYEELAADLPANPASARPPAPPAIVVRPPPPPAPPTPPVRKSTEPRIPVKPAAPPPPPPPPPPPKVPKIVIRPQPPVAATTPPTAETERIVKAPPEATPAPSEAPGEDDTDIEGTVAAPSEETDIQPPVREAPGPKRGVGIGGRAGKRAMAPPPPQFVALDLDSFPTQEVYRRVRYIFHPLKLMTCALLVLVALMAGGLIKVGSSDFSLVAAAWIYFAFVGIFHAIAALMTRFEIEGARGFHLLIPFLKRGLTLAINVGMAFLLLGSLAFFAVVARDMEKGMATLILSITGAAFVFMCVVFTMTGGYLNAILAVEMCGVREAFSRLAEMYRIGFRRVLGHSAVIVIFSYALFLVLFMPLMAHGVLWMSEEKFRPPAPFIFLVFGLASAFAVAALGTLNVYSYLWITRNLKTAAERAESETDENPPVEDGEAPPSGATEPPSEESSGAASETRASEPVESAEADSGEGRGQE